MKGLLSTIDLDDGSLIAKAKASPGLVGRDLAREVMPSQATSWAPGLDVNPSGRRSQQGDETGGGRTSHGTLSDDADRPHVVALDFGMKWNIPRHLVDVGCKVTIMPGSATAATILEANPDGIFISNGPGDPRALTAATATLKTLIQTAAEDRGIPIFGICLGHQTPGPGIRGRDIQAQVWTPRGQPPGSE